MLSISQVKAKKDSKSTAKMYKHLKFIKLWELDFLKNSLPMLILGNETFNHI